MAKFNAKFEVDYSEVDTVIASLRSIGSGFSENILEHAEQSGEAIGNLVIDSIRTKMPNIGIGNFMADRTKIEVETSGSRIDIIISGMTEGEAGHPPRSDGSVPKVSSADVNLWNTHEFGIPSEGSRDEEQNYQKDAGGVSVVRDGTEYGVGSPYVGAVKKIVDGLSKEVKDLLSAYNAVVSNTFIADVVEIKTEGKIKLDRTAASAFRRAGISNATLASLGVASAKVTSRGQILLFGPTQTGAAGAFVSGKGLIPTKITK